MKRVFPLTRYAMLCDITRMAKTKHIHAAVEPEMKSAVAKRAREMGLKPSDVVRLALAAYLVTK